MKAKNTLISVELIWNLHAAKKHDKLYFCSVVVPRDIVDIVPVTDALSI